MTKIELRYIATHVRINPKNLATGVIDWDNAEIIDVAENLWARKVKEILHIRLASST